MQEANAFYSRELRALLFGYFPASLEDAGVNLPGQVVFTCLSHDIVAHETTHALVDGQRSHFMEDTCVDSLAFHEAFADVVALFQHFSLKEALLDVIQRTGGKIYAAVVRPEVPLAGRGAVIQAELTRDNPLVGLAQQFGEAMGLRKALRSAIGTPPNSNALETTFEPHERGAILVAAVFDAFFSVYVRRTADLMRIARAGGAANGRDDLHPDLANRLADEATKTAGHFANICIRALDYCPAVEITFGDFLRAIITADSDTVPDDPYGYRAALIEAFRSRGIRPDGVASYAEESLRWSPPEIMTGRPRPRCVGLNAFGLLGEDPDLEDRTGDLLRDFVKENWQPLGLNQEPAASVPSFHAIQRARPDGSVCTQVVATALQEMEVLEDPTDPKQGTFTFRGGTTIIFDRDGNVVYAIQQRLGQDDASNKRLARTREHRLARQFMGARLTYEDGTGGNALPLSFELIHRGY
jgi:hypothetical protein